MIVLVWKVTFATIIKDDFLKFYIITTNEV